MKSVIARVGLLALLPLGCAGANGNLRTPDVPSRARAPQAVSALQASQFDEAARLAQALLAEEDRNAEAHLVLAVADYKRTMHQLVSDLVAIGASAFVQGINQRYLQFSLQQAEEQLAGIEAHLAAAARDPEIAFELCLADWKVDWNRNGRVDERDMRLLQVEVDAEGRPIPEGDPRRRPTFRFDRGDVFWARAMIAFQRAALNLGLAYQVPEIRDLLRGGGREVRELRFELIAPEQVDRARQRIEAGLAHSARSRKEYLAEKDDEREWLPNPRQKDHPLPLPVDAALYETWGGVLADLQKLVAGEEGLSVTEVAQLGDHVWADPPRGFIDVGGLLRKPGPIVIRLGNVERLDRGRSRSDVEAVLADLFGDKFKAQMKPSQLPARLARMKSEVERGEESLERKLRYLFWVN